MLFVRCMKFNNNAGVQDYTCPINARDITIAMHYAEEPNPSCSLEFLEMAQYVMNVHHRSFPLTVSAAVDLYVTMTTLLDNAM